MFISKSYFNGLLIRVLLDLRVIIILKHQFKQLSIVEID